MKPYAGLVNWIVRTFFRAISRQDIDELAKIPLKGPLIVVGNHVNFMEIPIVRSSLHPRDIVMLAKVETFRNPLLSFLFDTWGGIPIERGTADRDALQAYLDVLAQGRILAVAPEGTRSGDGRLLPGKSGIVPLAVRSGAPILPAAAWGHENYRADLKHLRRVPFHLRVGRPFVVDTHGQAMSKDVRQRITDEIMYKLAELLPEPYHGAYPHPEQVTYHFLREV